jgi:hypothetical protein
LAPDPVCSGAHITTPVAFRGIFSWVQGGQTQTLLSY